MTRDLRYNSAPPTPLRRPCDPAPGFVGISTHVSRHEAMKTLPPYDEFELLEESWRLVRVAMEHQVAVLKENQEVGDIGLCTRRRRKGAVGPAEI